MLDSVIRTTYRKSLDSGLLPAYAWIASRDAVYNLGFDMEDCNLHVERVLGVCPTR